MNKKKEIKKKYKVFEEELAALVIEHSIGEMSDTPNYLIVGYLMKCLKAINHVIDIREEWASMYADDCCNSVKTEWNIREYFKQLRFDKDHHLGLGDIRLTISQQEEICDLLDK